MKDEQLVARKWVGALLVAGALVACVVESVAQDAVEKAVPLSEMMRPGWAVGTPWTDGLSEVAEYEAREVRGGRARDVRVVVVTGAEDFGTEARARAEWPYGSRRVVESIRQRRFEFPRGDDALPQSVDLFADRRAPMRMLSMTVNRPSWEGSLTREFDFTTARPTERWSSFRESEGRGERGAEVPVEGLYEEQLALVVRGLEYRDGARATFALMEPVSTGTATEPGYAMATLAVERAKERPRLPMRGWQGELPWRVTVESGDARRIVFVVAAEEPHVVLSYEHGDGRSGELAAMGRRVFEGE